MFRGEYSVTMDPKGRLAVPSRYRERLAEACGGKIVLTISLVNPCLVVYPYPDWCRIETDLSKLPALDPDAEAANHLLIGHATEYTLDGHGRILVPPSLREHSGVGKRVRAIGLMHKFELWDEDRWSLRREEYLKRVGALGESTSEVLRALVL